MRVAVVGAGAVGARAARQLASSADVDAVVVHETDIERQGAVLAGLTDERSERGVRPLTDDGLRAVVLACPAGDHGRRAVELVAAGIHVVSVSDDLGDVRELLAL
ncbi:MAG: Gfo/Idh/MocA family oxidoreductase, partial [Acidimicrobiales bacterium]